MSLYTNCEYCGDHVIVGLKCKSCAPYQEWEKQRPKDASLDDAFWAGWRAAWERMSRLARLESQFKPHPFKTEPDEK